MKYKKIVFGLLLVATGFTACNKEFDTLLTNPNYPSTTTADVDLYLNTVQLNFNGFFQNASSYAGPLARQTYWGGPFYRNGASPSSFDGMWSTAYTGVIANADAMIPLAQSQKKYIQVGIARILKAYTLGTLVDMFGDVPFSQAAKGADNTTPAVDGGAAVYASVQSLLDSAIADLGNTSAAAAPKVDLYYGGSAAKWITLANTLKLKFYMQTRLVDASAKAKIQTLLTANNLINAAGNDFVFQYGKSLSPDSRHPDYAGDYNNNGGGGYLSNYFIWKVASEKYTGNVTGVSSASVAATTGDPRLRYYFYRQSTSNNYSWANESSCPCILKSQYGSATYPVWYPSVPDQTPYCVVGGRGYMGRDHGDNSGGPPDGAYKTQHGIYPAGGEFDYSQNKALSLGLGAGGNGISPIWLSSFTAFLKAEAVLTLGVTADKSAAALVTSGVTQSIAKVTGFPAAIGYVNTAIPAASLANSTQTAAYIALVDGLYAGAATDAAKLDVLMSEYHIALWGNGIEPYNNIRRTGSPKNVQLAATTATPGLFMRSFYYPSVFVDRNSNAPAQKTPGVAANKVFWDNNPDNFIK